MPKIEYINKRFRASSLEMIDQANEILIEYEAQGFDLTLRQLYYQFVSRDLISNTVASYKQLGHVVNDARLAGLIDWERIEDRTRSLRGLDHWESPAQLIEYDSQYYHIDKWKHQKFRPEVWIEKDALVGVISRVCNELDISYFSCRGYSSQSEMWRAGRRLLSYIRKGQKPLIIHLGDHDPSGMDMSRDIMDRLKLFIGNELTFKVNRIALNMDQVNKYNPPPNPAKLADPRADLYIEMFGDKSWELDALEPKTIEALIRKTVGKVRDERLWRIAMRKEINQRELLQEVSNNWNEIIENL